MNDLIQLEDITRDMFKKVILSDVDYDDFCVYEKDTKYESFFKEVKKAINTDKELDTVLLTKSRYSIDMHTDKTGMDAEQLDKEVWLVPVAVHGLDQFIRYKVNENKTDKDISYSPILEMDQFDIFKFNARKPHAYINNSWNYIELMSLWFKKG